MITMAGMNESGESPQRRHVERVVDESNVEWNHDGAMAPQFLNRRNRRARKPAFASPSFGGLNRVRG